MDQWKSSDRHLAFVADMDAQFIFVPKPWVRYILMVKILRIQANLIYDSSSIYLASDKFVENAALMYKLRSLNHKNVESILKQAHSLSTVKVSDFWNKLQVI